MHLTNDPSMPWHERKPTLSDQKWFNNLTTLHTLSNKWLERYPADSSKDFLASYHEYHPELKWLLHNDINVIFQHWEPRKNLRHLETIVRKIHLEIFTSFIWPKIQLSTDQPQLPHDSSVENKFLELESISLMAGSQFRSKLPNSENSDFSTLSLLFLESPFARFCDFQSQHPYVLKRVISSEFLIEWRECPHLIPISENFTTEVRDGLCRNYQFWHLGLLRTQRKNIEFKSLSTKPVCLTRFYFKSHATIYD